MTINYGRKRRVMMTTFYLLLLASAFIARSQATPDNTEDPSVRPPLSPPTHTSNHAVIVSSSRYWFNYRHAANALSIYQLLRTYGFSDENIILMIADEYAVNPRNPAKNKMYNTASRNYRRDQRSSLQTEDIEIDYRGEDVTVSNLIAVLTGRGGKQQLPVLKSDENSHVLIYMTGHGGDQFFKFQDQEEIMTDQIAETLQQMHLSKMYKQILLVADTCQAFTLADGIIKRQVPNVIAVGSSLRGQSSYAYSSDRTLGLSVIEKYTHFFVEHVRNNAENRTMQEQTLYEAMVQPYTKSLLSSEVGATDAYSNRKLNEIPLRDFFANVQSQKFWSSELAGAVKEHEENDKRNVNMTSILHWPSDPSSFLLSHFEEKPARIMVEEANMQCFADNASPSCSVKTLSITSPSSLEAMEPSDMKFVLIITCLLLVVVGASARW